MVLNQRLLDLSRAWPAPAKATPIVAMLWVIGFASFNATAQTMSFEQMLQQVVDNYPSLQTTVIAMQRARLESVRVESQLGWQLNASAGVFHDMSSTFGTPYDRINANGNISRQLESGDTLGFVASLNRDDSETTFPGSPNPALSTHAGVNYRMPLHKGADNPALIQNREQAAVAVAQAHADRRNAYDQIASQLVDLYNQAAASLARINNIELAINRSQRLLKYNQDRAKLGIAEDKDLLQVRAQLSSREAELAALKMQWQSQRVNLNRLMGRDVNADLQLLAVANQVDSATDEALLEQATQHSPALAAIHARLQQADAAIAISRDKRKNKLDLVLAGGVKSFSGDSTPADVSESEMVASVQIEYGSSVDLSGFDAELQQAQLARSAALQDQKQIAQDLRYNLAALQTEISSGQIAFQAYGKSVNSEQIKLKEAEQRYRRGRSDTDQLIQFEAALASAELNQDLQHVELQRRDLKLGLMTGAIWKNIRLPE